MEHNSDGDAAFPARGRLIIRSSHHRATAALVGLTRSRCLLLAVDRRFALSLGGGAFGSSGDDGAGWGLCQRGLLQEYQISCIPCMPMLVYYYSIRRRPPGSSAEAAASWAAAVGRLRAWEARAAQAASARWRRRARAPHPASQWASRSPRPGRGRGWGRGWGEGWG